MFQVTAFGAAAFLSHGTPADREGDRWTQQKGGGSLDTTEGRGIAGHNKREGDRWTQQKGGGSLDTAEGGGRRPDATASYPADHGCFP